VPGNGEADPKKEEEKEAAPAVEVPAVSQIQDAAKWMIGAFGAVAAIVAAGIQFGDIGKLTGWDLVLAIAGTALAFLGIAVSIYAIARLLVPPARSVNDLVASDDQDAAVKWLNENLDVLTGFDSLAALKSAREEDRKRYREAYEVWRKEPTEEHAKRLRAATELQKPTDEIASRVVSWANYHTLRASFEKSLRAVVLPAIVLAAGGLSLFAVKVSEKQPDQVVSNLEGRTLSGSDLTSADLGAANLKKANLSTANLTDANLEDTDLSGANLSDANLSGATLKGATVDKETNLDGVTWAKTICPDGTKSSDAGETCQAHLRAPEEEES
jgi:pentapeptide repeat protein